MTSYCQRMMDDCFLIPVDLSTQFDESKVYIFQNSLFWPKDHIAYSDRDYAVFLLKRSLQTSGKFALFDYEEDRIRIIMKDLNEAQLWEQVIADTKDQMA